MNTVPENPCVVNGIPDAYSSFWSSPSLDPSGKHINQGPELRLKTGKRMRPFRKTKKRCCLEYQCYPEVCTVTSPGVWGLNSSQKNHRKHGNLIREVWEKIHADEERHVHGYILSRIHKLYDIFSHMCAVEKLVCFSHSFYKYLLSAYPVAESVLRCFEYINKWSRHLVGKRQWAIQLHSMLKSDKYI